MLLMLRRSLLLAHARPVQGVALKATVLHYFVLRLRTNLNQKITGVLLPLPHLAYERYRNEQGV